MTGRQISMIWAQGIAAGTSVYLVLDSFEVTRHNLGFGVFFGACVTYFSFKVVGEK